MTEKEKCALGELYDANYDAELLAERRHCQHLCHELNRLYPSQEAERSALFRQILGKAVDAFAIISPFYCDYGYNTEVGANFFANFNCVILDEAKVSFGDNVVVAPNCGFYTAGYPLDAERRNRGLEYARPILVGHNVWIGANNCVLPGVTIGDSAVNRDIPPCVVAAGNPCWVIRRLDC